MKILPEIPFSFGYSTFLRGMMPGFILSVGLFYPLGYPLWKNFDWAVVTTFFVISVVFFGSLVSVANPLIVQLFSGKVPGVKPVCLECKILKKIYAAIDALASSDERGRRRFDEIWDWLRYFPTHETVAENVWEEPDLERLPGGLRKRVSYEWERCRLVLRGSMSGEERDLLKNLFQRYTDKEAVERLYQRSFSPEPFALKATVFGNIVAGYKDYGDKRYGIDTEFLWYRIWLTIDKDTRSDITAAAAEVDCVIHCSFVWYLLSSIYLGATLELWIWEKQITTELSGFTVNWSVYTMSISVVALWLIGYAFYRWSLPLLRTYVDLLKAAHDVFVRNVAIKIPTETERSVGEQRFLFFQYGRIRCSNEDCGCVYYERLDQCPECGASNPIGRP